MKKLIIPTSLFSLLIANKTHACLVASWVDTKPLLSSVLGSIYNLFNDIFLPLVVLFFITILIALFSKKEKTKAVAKTIWRISLGLIILGLIIIFVVNIPDPNVPPCWGA